eukprot:SAG31_NODE_34875_length_328_cov_0.899563_1_plen_79_part_10
MNSAAIRSLPDHAQMAAEIAERNLQLENLQKQVDTIRRASIDAHVADAHDNDDAVRTDASIGENGIRLPLDLPDYARQS